MILTKEMRERIRERRSVYAIVDGVTVPGSIAYLEELLERTRDPYDFDHLLLEISGEYARVGLYEQQLQTARRRVDNLSDDVLVRIELARRLSYSSPLSKERKEEAKKTIDSAIAMARATNEWVRAALAEQAWIGIRIEDSALFTKAMEELIKDVEAGRTFEVDSRLFHEIIREIPRDFVSSDLVDRYRAILRDSGSIPL